MPKCHTKRHYEAALIIQRKNQKRVGFKPVGHFQSGKHLRNDLTKGLDWSKCKAVTTDGTPAMQGLQKEMIKRKKQFSRKCV